MSTELSYGWIEMIFSAVKSIRNRILDEEKPNSKDKTIVNNTIIIIPPKE